VLVTSVSGDPPGGEGEWGDSALVEVDGQKILYHTGASPELVLRNARALNVDLSGVDSTAVVSTVGSSFMLEQRISTGVLAR
jgi:metal-dependent hydrolase (beta-lactamase superfamily II)